MLGLLKDAGSEPPTGRSGRTVCDAEKALDRLGYDTPIIDCIAGQQLAAVGAEVPAGSLAPHNGRTRRGDQEGAGNTLTPDRSLTVPALRHGLPPSIYSNASS